MDPTLQPLLERLRGRACGPEGATDMGHIVPLAFAPPVSTVSLDHVEHVLDLRFPSLLRAIYLEIGDGGFGPGYGLLPLSGSDETIAGITQALRLPDPDDPLCYWPPELLVICHWGCAIYSCVDCADPEAPIIRFDPNGHEFGQPWGDAFHFESTTLRDWLEDWLSGRLLHK